MGECHVLTGMEGGGVSCIDQYGGRGREGESNAVLSLLVYR